MAGMIGFVVSASTEWNALPIRSILGPIVSTNMLGKISSVTNKTYTLIVCKSYCKWHNFYWVRGDS